MLILQTPKKTVLLYAMYLHKQFILYALGSIISYGSSRILHRYNPLITIVTTLISMFLGVSQEIVGCLFLRQVTAAVVVVAGITA